MLYDVVTVLVVTVLCGSITSQITAGMPSLLTLSLIQVQKNSGLIKNELNAFLIFFSAFLLSFRIFISFV